MAYKIGIVTKNLAFYKLLDQQRRSCVDYEMVLVRSIEALNQAENSGKIASSFIFDSSLGSEEIIKIGSHISRSSKYKGAKNFLALEDYDVFKTITTSDEFSNATFINMPSPAEDIYKKITSDKAQLENKEIKAAQSSKTVSSASFLNIFIESTMATVKEMTNCTTLEHGTPELLNYDNIKSPIAIRGKLAINSPHFNGSFFIGFPEKTYLNLCTIVLMEKTEKIDKENEDLVSELCNIVYGKSKVLIAKLDMKLDMAIPTYNRDPKVVSKDKILLVKFNTEMGEFYIKVAPGLL